MMQIDRSGRRISLSIKALEVEEEKQAVEEYGSPDSGASLGDILGAALSRKQQATAADDGGAEVPAADSAEADATEEAKEEAKEDDNSA